MNYTEAKKNLQTQEKKLLHAEKKLNAKKAGLSEARQKAPKLHEELTDVMAQLEVDEATEKDVSEAQRKWEQAKERIEDLKTEIKATEKSIPLFQQKINDAREKFKPLAYQHYKKKAEPVTNEMIEAIEQLQKANNQLSELWDEIEGHNLSSGNYLPLPLELDKVKPQQMKKQPTERYLNEANQLTN